MLSRIYNFISHHRRKIFGMAVTGAMIWGGWTYFSWKMRKSEEEYVREVLNRAKRHMHHKSSAQAAEKQAIALLPVATKATNNALDTNAIVAQLKRGPTISPTKKSGEASSLKDDKVVPAPITPEERLSKWDELKRVSIARAVAFAYVPSILIVFLRLQLGVLGGYVYRSCGGDNIAAFLDGVEEEKQNSLAVEIQEAYLSLSQYFLEGHPTLATPKKENPLRVLEACWEEAKEGQRQGKSKLNIGKSKLNSSYRSNGLNKNSEDTCTSKSHQKPITTTVDHATSSSAGGVSGIEGGAHDNNNLTNDNHEVDNGRVRIKGNNHLIRTKGSSQSSKKDENVLNGISHSCNSSDSGTQSGDLRQEGGSDDEAVDRREVCGKETVEEDSGRCSGIDEPEDDMEVEKKKSGIEMLCLLLEDKVGRVVGGTSLKMPLSLADTETLFWGVLSSIRANPAEDPAFNLPKYLLPPADVIDGLTKNLEGCLGHQAAATFQEMVSETADLLETKEVVELVQSCISAGLGNLMDRIANHYDQDMLNVNGPPKPVQTSATHPTKGTSRQKTIPMAKLIPIISKVAFEDGSPWFHQLLEMSNLKDFGANVYEAFTR